MGYNGGLNKRGYYRRNNGMHSKSSIKSGTKLVTDIFFGGLGLIATLGNSSLDKSNNLVKLQNNKVKHFNPLHQRIKYIILGIFAILCPITGITLFKIASWWIFFCVLVCGSIETIICITSLPVINSNNYIYKNEEQHVKKICKGNLNILRGLYIVLFILNLYPLFSHDLYLITFILVMFKLIVNIDLIRSSFNNEIKTEEYSDIRSQKK